MTQAGEPALRVRAGRSLRKVPLGKDRKRTHGGLGRLSSLEKVRLDARRVMRAARMSRRGRLETFVRIANRRIPHREDATAARDRLGLSSDDGVLDLATAVERRIGTCRERAALLDLMFRETGLRSRLRYGRVYDRQSGEFLDAHAWVEVRSGRRWYRVDPSADAPVEPLETVWHPISGQPARVGVGSTFLYELTEIPGGRDRPETIGAGRGN